MGPLPDKLRAFVAIRLSPEVESRVEKFIERFRVSRELEGMRWVSRANLHATLHFLGVAVPAATISRLDPLLEAIGAATEPFVLEARGAGAFPSVKRPRVVWIGMHNAALTTLAERITRAARECGLPSPSQPYSPHLTIGRVRRRLTSTTLPRMIATAADHDFGLSEIDSIILFRSVLGATAAHYEELARYPLGTQV